MSTPASLKQISKFVKDALGDPDKVLIQYLLANGKFFRELARADFSRINFDTFTKSLTPALAPIAWNPVSGYATKISEWNKLRGWGLTSGEIVTFSEALVDHLDPLRPTGISLWLGHDLPFNWKEVIACLKLEVEALGEAFNSSNFCSKQLSFYRRSEQSGRRKLTVALLDIQTYWSPNDFVVPDEVQNVEKRLPGLEVAWLLALNPQVYLAIDYETVPGLIAAGLVVDSDGVVLFARDSVGAYYVFGRWAGVRWYGYSVVRFR